MASPSLDLQAAVYQRLTSDQSVNSMVGGRVFDNVHENPTFPYISFGPSYYSPSDSEGIAARDETLQVDIWTNEQGKKRPCRVLTDAVKKSLHGYAVEFAGENALVEMEVTLVRVMDDPSESIVHGVVQVTAMIEEA
ncbi:DUF3168 domain-containing protein [Cereibacter sphaeroides]|uniref:DUF3168 domain-containing protein n=1 Tax=Cereibacter sphaeroides TaxID=1063 RepID=A0AAX1UMX1_CERSP|nr:DUF3168 domain-containing protein [Cereibacter sphaeroides]RHZ96464.1 DUF3168 domain-containing protein [Cereibacter sphaeroides]